MKRICKDQNLADLHPEVQRIWNTRKKEPETQVFDWGPDAGEYSDPESMADAQKVIAKAMAGLSDRVTLVLTCRYWLDMTFVEVASDLNVSTERIRQLDRVGRMILRKTIREIALKEDIKRFTVRRILDGWRKQQNPNKAELEYKLWRNGQNPRRMGVSPP